MSKKKVQITRVDGVKQSYHVGVNASIQAAPAVPAGVVNPYEVESSESVLERFSSNALSSNDKYAFMVEQVKHTEPELYEQYLNLHKGQDLTSQGFNKVFEAVDRNVEETTLNNMENLEGKADKLLTNFGHKEHSEELKKMAVVSIMADEALKDLNERYSPSARSDEEYLSKSSVLRISHDILNGNLMSREPGH